jgi:hypothetical protein
MLTKDDVIQKILNGLEKQAFADWYSNGNFDKWISGDLPAVTTEQVKKDIEKLFNLPS